VSLEGRVDLKKSNLRILHIDGVFGELGEECLSGITSILKTVPAINSLRSFHLTIYIGFAVDAGPEALRVLDAGWESLAAQIKKLSSGKPLAFHIFINFRDSSEYSQRPEIKVSESVCANQLRTLVSQGLQILRKDPVITIFNNFHVHVKRGCLNY
jgi:hypothetical protein